MTLLNRTKRTQTVELRGLAYAGQGMWDHWWTQHDIHLPPSGSWTALNYEIRFEKLEARDGLGRLLAAFDLRQGFPEAPWWETALAVSVQPQWQPFPREEQFGQELAEGPFFHRWRVRWRTLAPGDLPQSGTELSAFRRPVITAVPASALTGAQRDALLQTVLRGRSLIVTGSDRSRLAGWEPAGLLAAPVRGTRTLPGLRSLAWRYGLSPLPGPVAVADVGAVLPPARVMLAEGGVPLVIERPLGMGALLFVTFDPTRPPFRGSAAEKPFWQEWLGRAQTARLSVHVGPEEAAAYRQIRRELRLQSPSTLAMLAASGLYLALLALTLAFRRRIRAVAALSLGAALAALALGPVVRCGAPVAAQAGTVYLGSGDRRGIWWGSAEAMLPEAGVATVRVPRGSADVWRAPRLRLPQDPETLERPLLERWVPLSIGQVQAPIDAPGNVAFELELEGDSIWASVRNGLPYALQDVTVVWGKIATLRLGDLAAGERVRRLLARVTEAGDIKGHTWLAGRAPLAPEVYGRTTGWGDTPDQSATPVLLAYAPRLPSPSLLLDERPVSSRHHAALIVRASGWRASGAFRLPAGVAPLRVVQGRAWNSPLAAHRGSGWLQLTPGGSAVLEAQLPGGPGARRWDRLELRGYRDPKLSLRLEAFDRVRHEWIPVAAYRGEKPSGPQPPRRFAQQWTPPPIPVIDPLLTVRLPSSDRFVDPLTQTMLLRATNAMDAPGGGDVQIEVDGHASAR